MEQHRNTFLWIRAACWAVIFLAAYGAVLLPDPARFAQTFGITTSPGPGFGTGLLVALPFMAGWALLLFWAHRSPVERREVLLVTALPVLAGLIVMEASGILQGMVSASAILPVMILQAILAVWLGMGYFAARNAARTGVA